MNIKNIFFLALIFGLTFTSCGEDQDEIVKENPSYIPKIEVQASVFGVVTNMDKESVADAIVTFDGKTTTTDAHGVFRFENENMYQDGTYITIKKDGYFQGSRRFYPREGKESRVGIELMPLTIIDQIESTAASKVKFEDVELDFSANSIVTESGASYTGTVNIAARYLDPTEISFYNQMPGDVTGINIDNEIVHFSSFGMIDVQLLDDFENKLQIREGYPVSVLIPIPAELESDAPAAIILWHFDEEMGIWVEEEEAIKVGDSYEVLLPHFSLWGLGNVYGSISVSGTILYNGNAISGVPIGMPTLSANFGLGLTDESGYFQGWIPENLDLTIEVANACGIIIYSEPLGVHNTDFVLDPINISDFLQMLNITGSVAHCSNDEISDLSYIVLNVGGTETIVNIEEDQTFNGIASYCNSTEFIRVFVYDAYNNNASASLSFTIDGNIDVGEIELCEVDYVHQFIYKYGDNIINVAGSSNEQDSLLIYSINKVDSGNETFFTLNITNWGTNETAKVNLIYEMGKPIKDVRLEVIGAGFTAIGQGSSQLIEQDGIEYYLFKGALPDIEVCDAAIYNEDHSKVDYSIVIPK